MTDNERRSHRSAASVGGTISLLVGGVAFGGWLLSAVAALTRDTMRALPTAVGATGLVVIGIGLAVSAAARKAPAPERDDRSRAAPTEPEPPWATGGSADPISRREIVVVAAVLIIFSLVVTRLIAVDAALGWDESVYAVRHVRGCTARRRPVGGSIGHPAWRRSACCPSWLADPSRCCGQSGSRVASGSCWRRGG